MTTLRVPGRQAERSQATRELPATAPPVCGTGQPGLSTTFSTAPEFRKMNRMPATSTYWSVSGMPWDWVIQPPLVRESVPRAWL